MKNYLNLPTLILVAFLARLLILGTSISDSLIMLGLLGLYGFYYFIESKKEEPVNKEIHNRIVELEENLKVTREKVSAITFGNTLRK